MRAAPIAALLLALGAFAEESTPPDDPKQEERETAAQEAFQAAAAHIEAGKAAADEKARAAEYEAAVAGFRKLAEDFKDTSYRGIAMFNAGVVLCDYAARYEKAIEQFQAVLSSDLNDKDSTGMLMDPYRNYRYHAWRMISTCREKLNQRGEAIHAAIHMKSAYETHCGTCRAGMIESVTQRCQALVGQITADVPAEDVTAAVEASDAGDAFLLALSRRLVDSKPEAAKKLVQSLVAEFPSSKLGDEAQKLLEKLGK